MIRKRYSTNMKSVLPGIECAQGKDLLLEKLKVRQNFMVKPSDFWSKLLCCCCRTKKAKLYSKLFDRAADKLHAEIDLLTIIKQLRVTHFAS